MKQFVITKKIAKHGKQQVILIPKFLEVDLPAGSIVKVTIDVIREVAQ